MGPLWREDPKTCVFFFQDNMSTKTKTYMKKEKNMALYGNKSLSDFFPQRYRRFFVLFCFVLFNITLSPLQNVSFDMVWCTTLYRPIEAREGGGGACTHGLSLLRLSLVHKLPLFQHS